MKEGQEKTREFLRDLLLTVPYLQGYQMIDWMILALTVFGLALTIRNRVQGLILLSIVDVSWAAYDASRAEYAQGLLFLLYAAMTAWGCQGARKSKNKPEKHA